MEELFPRLGALRAGHRLLTAISEAVEEYESEREAVLVSENERFIDVLILGEGSLRAVDGIGFVPSA